MYYLYLIITFASIFNSVSVTSALTENKIAASYTNLLKIKITVNNYIHRF